MFYALIRGRGAHLRLVRVQIERPLLVGGKARGLVPLQLLRLGISPSGAGGYNPREISSFITSEVPP
jgi:hypothetical protein